MVYRITGGIAFLLLGLQSFTPIPPILTAVFCAVAGIALLAGI
jgi:hypothetical protein